MKTYEITAAAALAAISAVLQVVHVGWMSPWGMWIDLVAVSWLVAYFLFGTRVSVIVSVIGVIIITFTAPSSWLGALMKWAGSVPVIASLAAVAYAAGRKPGKPFIHSSVRYLLIAAALAVLVRGAIVLPVNYYFALPIWLGVDPASAMQAIPWYIIFGLNAAQTAVELAIAWLLVFRFRLDRFSQWA